MQITEIIVSAGRTFNHPYESYSNLRPNITLKASISEGEDPEVCVKELQRKSERMVEDHKNNLLQAINEIEDMRSTAREIESLENNMRRAQDKLSELREKYPVQTPENLLVDASGEQDTKES